MEKRKKRDYLGARIYDVPTQGYGTELKIEPTAIYEGLDNTVYKSRSPNETVTERVLFGRGCSAEGCALVISLDLSLPEALAAFKIHNEADHNERYLQHMVYLYKAKPTDPTLGTEGEGVVK